MGFMNELENELNVSVTENGAVGYATTKNNLLDMNFKISSYRNLSEDEIVNDFLAAYEENPILAMQWLFFARDAREGAGERRLFRAAMKNIAINYPEVAKAVMSLIPEYGRWDDLFIFWDTSIEKDMIKFTYNQIKTDYFLAISGSGNASLLAKWMPSENASSSDSKKMARRFASAYGWSNKFYRVTLSTIRKYLTLVESNMSSNEWGKIDYNVVPSKANLIYKDAFMRHDGDRRQEFLNRLANHDKDVKINAKVLMPYEIVNRYTDTSSWSSIVKNTIDGSLEALWNNLPNKIDSDKSMIVVADGSGSMTNHVNSSVTALDVAQSLAIYCAERLNGEFKNKYITFSEHPQFVDMTKCSSLRNKLAEAYKHCEVANTNIEAVFDLILDVAVKNNMKQEEIPASVLVLSDMEFDWCVCSNSNPYMTSSKDPKLFKEINRRWVEAGYKMPKLIFWNIMSRTNTIPVKDNENGVGLVSGFSTSIFDMVMSNEMDPYKIMLSKIDSERYQPIHEALIDKIK